MSKSKNIDLSAFANTPAAKLNPQLFGKCATQKPAKKANKYNAVKVTQDGMEFDSTKEAKRHRELRLLLKKGDIGFLAAQVEFAFVIQGKTVGSYFADFVYTDMATGAMVVEDVKSEATRKLSTYRLKRRLMLVIHKIKIQEV